ncbi:MAG: branched chain amino acid aminotransferase [Chloroflexi bacterium]|nr:branched chain amino acid aminotransferase [Chloroflexota bacterium]MQG05225.1 branched-chain amino acid transaminase [SAR202 cluster bacterium]|tara:strand:+ start:8195 stop:9121 length:927 start_codon:yes stop_codon:yes gene_type:complete
MSKPLAFFKGDLVDIKNANVNIQTHALHYGTAVFEGIRGNWNTTNDSMIIFRLREHYERLIRGTRILLIDIPYDVDELCNITTDLVHKSGYKQDVYIRPIAYKSAEKIANLKLPELENDFALMIIPFGDYIDSSRAINCCTSSWRRLDDTNIPPRVKISGNYVNSILAKTEAVLAGFDEAIILNQSGSVSEGSGENLFIVNDGEITTPPLSDNNLDGITRNCVFEIAKQELGIQIKEKTIFRSELYLADEVFLTGTAAHITPVGQLDKRTIGTGDTGEITTKIQSLYSDIVRGNNSKYLDWCTSVQIS